jgi:hypothetical protein
VCSIGERPKPRGGAGAEAVPIGNATAIGAPLLRAVSNSHRDRFPEAGAHCPRPQLPLYTLPGLDCSTRAAHWASPLCHGHAPLPPSPPHWPFLVRANAGRWGEDLGPNLPAGELPPCLWEADISGSRFRPRDSGGSYVGQPLSADAGGIRESGFGLARGDPPLPKGGRSPGKRLNSHAWDLGCFLGMACGFLGGAVIRRVRRK